MVINKSKSPSRKSKISQKSQNRSNALKIGKSGIRSLDESVKKLKVTVAELDNILSSTEGGSSNNKRNDKLPPRYSKGRRRSTNDEDEDDDGMGDEIKSLSKSEKSLSKDLSSIKEIPPCYFSYSSCDSSAVSALESSPENSFDIDSNDGGTTTRDTSFQQTSYILPPFLFSDDEEEEEKKAKELDNELMLLSTSQNTGSTDNFAQTNGSDDDYDDDRIIVDQAFKNEFTNDRIICSTSSEEDILITTLSYQDKPNILLHKPSLRREIIKSDHKMNLPLSLQSNCENNNDDQSVVYVDKSYGDEKDRLIDNVNIHEESNNSRNDLDSLSHGQDEKNRSSNDVNINKESSSGNDLDSLSHEQDEKDRLIDNVNTSEKSGSRNDLDSLTHEQNEKDRLIIDYVNISEKSGSRNDLNSLSYEQDEKNRSSNDVNINKELSSVNDLDYSFSPKQDEETSTRRISADYENIVCESPITEKKDTFHTKVIITKDENIDKKKINEEKAHNDSLSSINTGQHHKIIKPSSKFEEDNVSDQPSTNIEDINLVTVEAKCMDNVACDKKIAPNIHDASAIAETNQQYSRERLNPLQKSKKYITSSLRINQNQPRNNIHHHNSSSLSCTTETTEGTTTATSANPNCCSYDSSSSSSCCVSSGDSIDDEFLALIYDESTSNINNSNNSKGKKIQSDPSGLSLRPPIKPLSIENKKPSYYEQQQIQSYATRKSISSFSSLSNRPHISVLTSPTSAPKNKNFIYNNTTPKKDNNIQTSRTKKISPPPPSTPPPPPPPNETVKNNLGPKLIKKDIVSPLLNERRSPKLRQRQLNPQPISLFHQHQENSLSSKQESINEEEIDSNSSSSSSFFSWRNNNSNSRLTTSQRRQTPRKVKSSLSTKHRMRKRTEKSRKVYEIIKHNRTYHTLYIQYQNCSTAISHLFNSCISHLAAVAFGNHEYNASNKEVPARQKQQQEQHEKREGDSTLILKRTYQGGLSVFCACIVSVTSNYNNFGSPTAFWVAFFILPLFITFMEIKIPHSLDECHIGLGILLFTFLVDFMH